MELEALLIIAEYLSLITQALMFIGNTIMYGSFTIALALLFVGICRL